jgi:hypothetical protein
MSSANVFPWEAGDWLASVVEKLGWQERLVELPRPGRLLWHYTTINGFQNIVRGKGDRDAGGARLGVSRKIHLNPLDRMNDSQEGKWLSSHLGASQDWQDIRFSYAFRSPPISGTFAFSLSEERDLLSQWGYADGGRGIAIGFDPALLRDACQPISQWNELASGSSLSIFCKVEYRTSLQMHAIAKEIVDSTRLVEGEMNTFYANPDLDGWTMYARGKRYSQIFNMLKGMIDVIGPMFKNCAFHQEKEWRIIYLEGLPNLPTNTLELGYKYTENDIVRHYVLDIKDSIKALTIGPLCIADRRTIQVFLESVGLKIDLADITKSDATLQAR